MDGSKSKPWLALEIAKSPELLRLVWQKLNETDLSSLAEGGRVYGGGLRKLEPKELANIPAPQFHELLPASVTSPQKQLELFSMI